MPVLAEIVDGGALLEVVWVSFAAGLGATVVFALGIVGATRAVDLRRDGRTPEATIYAGLAALSGLGVVVGIVFAILAMTDK